MEKKELQVQLNQFMQICLSSESLRGLIMISDVCVSDLTGRSTGTFVSKFCHLSSDDATKLKTTLDITGFP